jgi:AhpD family alkylhydroperoxidase
MENVMSRHIKYVRPVAPASATNLVARVYAQMSADLGRVAEPVSVHAADPAILAGSWMMLRETLLVGHVARGVKEAVAGVVSAVNQCPWCLDAHSIMVRASGHNRVATHIGALASKTAVDRPADVDEWANAADGIDQKSVEILRWAAATRTPGHPLLTNPPFSVAEAPEFVGVAVTFHYLTRIVNATLSERFLMGPGWLRGATKRLAGRMLAGMVRRQNEPGTSLALLPETQLPSEFLWASSSPGVAGAFARFAGAVEAAGASALSPTARAVVMERLTDWRGEDPGLSRNWVERDTVNLRDEDRSGSRLALLIALAPHQIDAGVVEAYRSYHPSDASLIGALSWGSFAAARRLSSWVASGALVRPPVVGQRSQG